MEMEAGSCEPIKAVLETEPVEEKGRVEREAGASTGALRHETRVGPVLRREREGSMGAGVRADTETGSGELFESETGTGPEIEEEREIEA